MGVAPNLLLGKYYGDFFFSNKELLGCVRVGGGTTLRAPQVPDNAVAITQDP